jgi:phosphoribosylformylglycinamidine synthase
MSHALPQPSTTPQAAVIVFPGSNGERDLFESLGLAGFAVQYLSAQQEIPDEVSLVGLPGGFSYGDYWRAGVLASRARAVRALAAFHARGGLLLGVCNGFQILVEAGYLKGALSYNHPPRFVHRWVDLEVTPAAARSPWFSSLPEGTRLRLPIAHAEGSYQHPEGVDAVRSLIPLRYVSNPNGSLADAAALLDDSGRILGIMPHPERACDQILGSQDGLRILQAAHKYLQGRTLS